MLASSFCFTNSLLEMGRILNKIKMIATTQSYIELKYYFIEYGEWVGQDPGKVLLFIIANHSRNI